MSDTRVRNYFPDRGKFEELLKRAEQQARTPYEMNACADFRKKWTEWGSGMFLSLAQLEYLKKIAR